MLSFHSNSLITEETINMTYYLQKKKKEFIMNYRKVESLTFHTPILLEFNVLS